MINDKALLSAVNAYYSKIRSERLFAVQRAEEEAEKNERYSELKYELNGLKIERQKAEFNGETEKADDLSEKIAALQGVFDELKKRVAVKQAEPNCPLCRDSGFSDGKPCKCYTKKLSEFSYDHLGVKNVARHTFDDDELSEKAGLKSIYSAIRSFTEKMPETEKNVLILGQKGTGKTFLSECAVNAIENKGMNAIMLTAFSLNKIFANGFNLSANEKTTTENILTTSDLLVIDDLGTEPIYNKITIENLTAVISERLTNKKPFFITTNLTLDEICARYGERLFSRLCGRQTVILKMNGKDLRLYNV